MALAIGAPGTAVTPAVFISSFPADDIRVDAVSPGTIDTDFHANINATKPEVFESWRNNILMKRLGQPQEVASVIEFLVSDKASFLTGEIVQINGGQDFL